MATVTEWVSDYFKRRVRNVPALGFILAAIILIVVGQFIQATVDLRAIQSFCETVVHDLGTLQPLSFAGRFYGNWLSLGAHDVWWPVVVFVYPFVAWYQTGLELWNSTDLPAHILIPLAILAALWPANRIGIMLVDEENPFHLVATVILLPIVAGLLALALQYVLIAIFFVFGQLIGLALIIIGTFGWILGLLTKGWDLMNRVEDKAVKVEAAMGVVAAITTPVAVEADAGEPGPSEGTTVQSPP